MNTLPASTVPASGTSAASAAGATGAASAESQSTANPQETQLDQAAIMAAFLGETPEESPQAATTQPGQESDSSTAPDAGATPDGEGEESETVENPTQDNPVEHGDLNAPLDDKKKYPIDHLLERLKKNPDDPKLLKRLREFPVEAAKLKTQLEEATAKLADADGPPVMVQQAQAEDPLANVANVTQLHETVTQAKASKANSQAWVDWCLKNRDGGTPPGHKAGMDAEQVAETLSEEMARIRQADRFIEAAPAKMDFFTKQASTREVLRKSRPELFIKDSPELAECITLFKEGRVNASLPDSMQDAADMAEGRRARQEREKGITTVKLQPPNKGAASAAQGQQAQRPGPQGGAAGGKAPAMKPAGAGADVVGLRKRIEAGDRKAGDDMARAFLAA
jgi:hypothetical protein